MVVVGPAAHDAPVTASGAADSSGEVVPARTVTGLEGIRGAVEAGGGTVAYVNASWPNGSVALPLPPADAAAVAGADAVVFFVGTSSGKGGDRPNLALGGSQDALVASAAALNPATAAVVNAPGAVLLGGVAASAAAVLLTWLPGQEAGHAAADVLFGRINPLALPNVDNEVNFTAAQYPGMPAAYQHGDDCGECLVATYSEGLEVGGR